MLKLSIEDFTEELVLIDNLDWNINKKFDMLGVFELR